MDQATKDKITGIVRAALAASGPIYPWLAGKLGFDTSQMGTLVEVLIYLAPVVAAGAWSLYDKIEAKIIERAALLIKPQGGAIVAPTAARGTLGALADDQSNPAVTNVVRAGGT